jgi:hypothetical protein
MYDGATCSVPALLAANPKAAQALADNPNKAFMDLQRKILRAGEYSGRCSQATDSRPLSA